MKLESQVETITRIVDQHRAIVAAAETKANAERDALATRQAADKAALAPIVQKAADLANTLTALTSKRDVLTEELRIGRHQLTCQQGIADDFKSLAVRNFGDTYCAQNPGIFFQVLQSRPHGLLALLIIPWLESWISKKAEALEETENQIATLAQTAKAPTK